MIIRLESQSKPLPYSFMVSIDYAVITAQDTRFFEGFQCGYAEFLLAYQGKLLSEQDIYKLLMKIVEVERTGIHQAGFITGWMTAMLEPVGGSIRPKLIKIVRE